MFGFLLIVLGVLGGGILFLSHRLAFAPRWPQRWLRWLITFMIVALTGLSFLQFGAGPRFLSPESARPIVWAGATWLTFALYLVLGLIPVALVSLAARWIPFGGRRDPQRPGHASSRSRRVRVNRLGVPVVVTGALVMTAFGVARADDPALTAVTVASPDLPVSFDGTTVAVVTDLHAGPVRSAAFTRRVVDRVNAAEPDLVVLVGDVIDGPVDRFGADIAPLADLRAPLGVLAVTGNHEMYSGTIAQWEQRWRELGITVVSNRQVALDRDGERITVGGIHDLSGTGDFAPDPAAAVAGVAPTDFAMILAHQPRQASSLDNRVVDLQISGHTHGGQLWPFRRLVLAQQPVIDGLHPVDGIPVLTSRGAGTWGPPTRIGADPEIPLITLRRA